MHTNCFFIPSRLVFNHEHIQRVPGKSSETSPPTREEMPQREIGEKAVNAAQQKCDDLEKMSRVDDLRKTFHAYIDTAFASYKRDCIDEKISKSDTALRIELSNAELTVNTLIKNQFEKYIASLDLCKVSPAEIEKTMMQWYGGLDATIRFWQVQTDGKLAPAIGRVYNMARRFAEKAPLGSGKVLMIDPSLYTALTSEYERDRSLVMDQKSLGWGGGSREGKLYYLRKRFDDIGHEVAWGGPNNFSQEYIAKTVDAIGNHPNFDKMDAQTAMWVLGAFANQTKVYNMMDGYSANTVIRTVVSTLDYLS